MILDNQKKDVRQSIVIVLIMIGGFLFFHSTYTIQMTDQAITHAFEEKLGEKIILHTGVSIDGSTSKVFMFDIVSTKEQGFAVLEENMFGKYKIVVWQPALNEPAIHFIQTSLGKYVLVGGAFEEVVDRVLLSSGKKQYSYSLMQLDTIIYCSTSTIPRKLTDTIVDDWEVSYR